MYMNGPSLSVRSKSSLSQTLRSISSWGSQRPGLQLRKHWSSYRSKVTALQSNNFDNWSPFEKFKIKSSHRLCPWSTQQKRDMYPHHNPLKWPHQQIREAKKTIVHFFLTLFKRPLTPPLVLNMYVANFVERLLKKCVNVCHDKIRQKNA